MGPGMMEDEEAQSDVSEDTSESATIFLTKEQLGGKDFKVGDTLTLKASDKDPETGEVAFEVVSGGITQPQTRGSAEDEFDKAMPLEEEE